MPGPNDQCKGKCGDACKCGSDCKCNDSPSDKCGCKSGADCKCTNCGCA